ncbi:MAG: glycosyltransferase family 2 protein [Nitrospirae bacterium]|nr:glycosyltransferase family 2 protein [Nitrospirota bacterium]
MIETQSGPTPLISVVICTHNRADYLNKAIRSVLDQSLPGDRYELIVVDNASTDHTRETVRAFEPAGNVRYLYEGTLGLCHARNTGWQQARGRYVVYLDDDAVACPGWLAAVKEAFATAPDIGVVGGRVEPIWEGERPAWLSDDLALGLTILDWSDTPKFILDVRREWLVGANMAAPTAVLKEIGGFHPGLDRVGTRMLSSGDVYLQKQILRRGYSCLYHPMMAVRHLVPRSRLEKRWFIRRYYWQGLSNAAMQLIEESPSIVRRASLAASMVFQLLRSPRKIESLVRPVDDPRAFTQKCYSFVTLGHIAGLLGALGR